MKKTFKDMLKECPAVDRKELKKYLKFRVKQAKKDKKLNKHRG